MLKEQQRSSGLVFAVAIYIGISAIFLRIPVNKPQGRKRKCRQRRRSLLRIDCVVTGKTLSVHWTVFGSSSD